MSADNIFDKLFELINQPGAVNYNLAMEVARHITGSAEPLDPWAAEELMEIARAAELKGQQIWSPPPDLAECVLFDSRGWAEQNIRSLSYIVENMVGNIEDELDFEGDPLPPGGERFLRQLRPVFLGTQIGSLVGSMSSWVMGSFEIGFPPEGEIPPSLLVPNLEQFIESHDTDPKTTRMWAVLNELAHRHLFGNGWGVTQIKDRLAGIREALPNDLEQLGPEVMEIGGEVATEISGDMLSAFFDQEEVQAQTEEVKALFSFTGSLTRRMVYQAVPESADSFAELYRLRDEERMEMIESPGSPMRMLISEAADLDQGEEFCQQIEQRYGSETLTAIRQHPDRIPTAAELTDPVGWAARAWLDDFPDLSISPEDSSDTQIGESPSEETEETKN